MKTTLFSTALLLVAATGVSAEQVKTDYSQHQWQNAPADYFSGKARFTRLPEIPDSPDRTALVEFQAGSVTNWHSHSQGQYLIVTKGEGRTQEWGKPVQVIKEGDVVWCPPNVKHWHGATAHSSMSHIAVSPNASENKVTWLEKVDLTAPDPKVELQKISQHQPLSRKQLAIVPIVFYSAKGYPEQLKPALEQGLASGLTPDELEEIFAHQYAYAGFPRALNGLHTLQNLLKERAAKGIADSPAKSAQQSQSAHDRDYYTLGTQTLNVLTQRDNSALLQNSEGMDYALKAHLFGYLFSRNSLSTVNRELVAVATLAALETVPNQLRSHFSILKNLGLSQTELQRVISELAVQDQNVADKAEEVLQKVFNP
ncbi:cupin domain-containing carboxymuconolactone decarboxylase family protein [Rodentibacter myodis]|uniref:Carboxymuconolactone decarboxylase n=1 Tax=Rodentibacter myodis TaxID=1907939 RepID=A0A1V3JNN5_9PAST|nr:carboxymuconolactone decarboxylase family protein [Rodentibacter myodis]OOF58173.1 carboxymuconolactone decarboxylase [Rodentibacter myodis]